MTVLHHYVPAHIRRRQRTPSPTASAVLGFLVGFVLALLPCAVLAHDVVPALLPLGGILVDPATATGLAVTGATVVGLAGAVWALARNTSRR